MIVNPFPTVDASIEDPSIIYSRGLWHLVAIRHDTGRLNTILYTTSEDGKEWSEPREICQGPVTYPKLTVDRYGRLHMVYAGVENGERRLFYRSKLYTKNEQLSFGYRILGPKAHFHHPVHDRKKNLLYLYYVEMEGFKLKGMLKRMVFGTNTRCRYDGERFIEVADNVMYPAAYQRKLDGEFFLAYTHTNEDPLWPEFFPPDAESEYTRSADGARFERPKWAERGWFPAICEHRGRFAFASTSQAYGTNMGYIYLDLDGYGDIDGAGFRMTPDDYEWSCYTPSIYSGGDRLGVAWTEMKAGAEGSPIHRIGFRMFPS